MKKLAIGCAVVLVLCMIGFGAVAFFVYYKANQYMASVKQFAAVAELDKKVTNKASFTAPGNAELTDDQVRRFVSVQEMIKAKMGPRVDELGAKMKQLDNLHQSEHRDASFSEVMGALGDLFSLIKDAKTAQVDSLNAQHFSLDEYKWVREQFYSAAGIAAANINFSDMQDTIKKAGGSTADLERLSSEVPEHNRALVKPYADKATKDWMAFAFFGL